MIKVIVFDLDGVLVDTRDLHYESLNKALEPHGFTVSREEHLSKYDGHPTSYKLNLLTKEKALPISLHNQIWKDKQMYTQDLLKDLLKPNAELIATLEKLSKSYKIFVASNAIWVTVKNSLLYSGLLPFVDYFISCEEVKHPKPSPEIYLQAFQHANVRPDEVLICEDSPIGIQSAHNSCGHVLPVFSKADISYEAISSFIKNINSLVVPKSIVPKVTMNVVVPMAGYGSRFSKAGYKMPKPLIDVCGKPMIQRVVENIGINARYIFIVQQEHYDKYFLNILLPTMVPGCEIVCLNGVTEGAACSVLAARELIDNDSYLLTANSDQYLEWNPYEFLHCSLSEGVDGCISTFASDHPKFSYARLDERGYVCEVAEKRVISEHATTGIYFWKRGADFVKYADQMIARDIRVNGEFYVAPVFNQAIEDGKKIKIDGCRHFHCLGTPEDLEEFLDHASAGIL